MKNKSKLFIMGVLGIFYALFFLLNYYTPMLEDDCNYALTATGERLQNFVEIIQTQIWHYFHMNGRFFAHTLIQTFCGLTGKWLFNLLNPLVWLTIPFVLLKILNIKLDTYKGVFLYFVTLAFLHFLIPDQYVAKLMIAGGVNYMWATLFYLTYIYWIKLYVLKSEKISFLKLVLFVILSFFVGGFVEFFSIALLPATMIVFFVGRKKYYNRTNVIILLAFLLGTVFVTLAPSNFIRKSSLDSQQNSVSFLKQTFNFIFYFSTQIYMLLSLIVVGTLLVTKRLNFGKIKLFLTENLFYVLSICFSLGFILVSGAWWSRVFVPFYLFLFILFVKIVSEVKLSKKVYISLTLFLIVLTSADAVYQINVLRYNYGIFKNLESQIIENNGGICIQDKKLKDARMANTSPWFISSINAKNLWLKGYYEVNPISIVPKETYELLEKNAKNIVNIDLFYNQKNKLYICSKEKRSIDYIEIINSDEPKLVLKSKIAKIFRTFGLLNRYPLICNSSDYSHWLYGKADLNKKIKYNDYHESFSVLDTEFGSFLLFSDKNEILPVRKINIVYQK